MKLQERIAALLRAGFRQSDIAQRAGVSQPTVSAATLGYGLMLATAEKIDAALKEMEAEVQSAAS